MWSRLRDDLDPYLADRGADGVATFTFFHRQFLERARARHLEPTGPLLHRRLAAYFGAQPLHVDAGGAVPNLRKLSELVFQQVAAGMAAETQAVLTSFAFLDARVVPPGRTRPSTISIERWVPRAAPTRRCSRNSATPSDPGRTSSG